MKKLAFPLSCALSILSANAANIVWVSFHGTDAPSSSAAGTGQGFTFAPDIGYTDLLRNAGHNVTRFLTINDINTSATAAGVLNAADLVIISRSVDSGHYGSDAETAFWHGITAPTMIMGGYLLRGGDSNNNNNRLGFTTGSTMPDTVGNVTVTVTNPSHPIFTGVTLGAGSTLAYATPVTTPDGSPTQRGISINSNPIAAGGQLIATTDTGGMVIGEWMAGTAMNTAVTTGPADVLAGHRMVFLSGSREHANTAEEPSTSQIAGIYDLTPEGAAVFLNAVNYMAVPEPSTYALLGLGALAIMARRRKA